MENEIKPKKGKSLSLRVLLVILLILGAFLAGIGGELFTRIYLSKLAFFRDFYFTQSSENGQQQIVIQEPRKVVVEQDLMANQVKATAKSSVLGIYKKKIVSKNLLDNVFLPNDYLGQAIVLTSDGWLISTAETVNRLASDLVASYNKKSYDIEKIVADPLTDIVFLKISAQNLPVVKFADFSALQVGQQVLAYNTYTDQIDSANILAKEYKAIYDKYDFVYSSQQLDKYIELNKSFNDNFTSAPILNYNSELIGLLSAHDNLFDKVIPIHYINSIINQVLKTEDIKRPYLGINYLDLSKVYGLTSEERQGADNGALIWNDRKGTAIYADSPLAGKLVKGDIIIKIENQDLSPNKGLLDMLLEFKSNQEISIKYLHDNKENTINIILK